MHTHTHTFIVNNKYITDPHKVCGRIPCEDTDVHINSFWTYRCLLCRENVILSLVGRNGRNQEHRLELNIGPSSRIILTVLCPT